MSVYPKNHKSDVETELRMVPLNEAIFNRFWVDLEIQFHSRSMSDPIFSDVDFKNKMDLV